MMNAVRRYVQQFQKIVKRFPINECLAGYYVLLITDFDVFPCSVWVSFTTGTTLDVNVSNV